MGNGTLATDYANVVDNNYARGADLTGNADGSKGICSFWFFPAVPTSATQSIYNTSPSSNIISFFPIFGNRLRFTFVQPSAATAFFMFNVTPLAVGVWHHILASWDLTVTPVPTGLQLFINDSSNIGTRTQIAGATIDYTQADHGFADNASFGGGNLESCVSEFYFAPNQFLDFSMTSNRRLFIDAAGDPVELGATGSVPTGTAPLMYFPDGDGATNAGTGGTFTLSGPAPVPCVSFPGVVPTLTPRDIIEIVRDEIDAAGIAETDDFLRLRLGFSESFLDDALSKFDEGDLRKVAKGVRKAVKFLELAVEKGFDSVQADEWGDRLCGAIRTIASDEIDAAIARTGDPIKIAEAQDAFADGELEKLFSEFLAAINDYEKAIKSATVA